MESWNTLFYFYLAGPFRHKLTTNIWAVVLGEKAGLSAANPRSASAKLRIPVGFPLLSLPDGSGALLGLFQ
jgi:hypothetical protein